MHITLLKKSSVHSDRESGKLRTLIYSIGIVKKQVGRYLFEG